MFESHRDDRYSYCDSTWYKFYVRTLLMIFPRNLIPQVGFLVLARVTGPDREACIRRQSTLSNTRDDDRLPPTGRLPGSPILQDRRPGNEASKDHKRSNNVGDSLPRCESVELVVRPSCTACDSSSYFACSRLSDGGYECCERGSLQGLLMVGDRAVP